ncbi:MAG TPA: M56 family metallopeptidase [Longimicrobium sp.]|nr:M56 family metallopeptidase [Longimicrobium sp.]
MIAHWMLYCLTVGALLSLAALAAERGMRAFALPQRWVWAAAMVLMLALPAAARWMPRAPAPVPATGPIGSGVGMTIPARDLAAPAPELAPRIDLSTLDGTLAIGWMILSGAAVLALAAAWTVLERRRRGWSAAEVDGVPVLLSPSTGPAVIGLFRSRIVLPRWVVADAPDEVRALLMEHEREHLRAGDPRLLALGLATVTLMPWNPAAWWQLRRLRLAVEVDCDARVLARRADVRAYGALLLEVGRRGTGGRLLAAAFSEPASFLERRIRIMTSPRLRRPWLYASGFGAAAVAMIVAACEAPGPVQANPSPVSVSVQPVRAESGSTMAAVPSSVRISRAAIESAVREHYPDVLQGAATDTATLMFVITPEGEIERHDRIQMRRMSARPTEAGEVQRRWRQSTGLRRPEVESSVVDVVTFSPGQMGAGRVEVVWVRKLSPDQMATATGVHREAMQQPASGSRERVPRNAAVQITREQAREHVARYFPQVTRGESTPESVWIISDASGQVVAYGDDGNSEQLNRVSDDVDNIQVFKGENLVFNGRQVGLIYVRLKG